MKIRELLTLISRQAEVRLRILCSRLSPTNRFVIVLTVCIMLAVINIYFLFNSVYNIGKNDTQKELIKLEHIEIFKIDKNDSINLLKQKIYEYE